jgi:hypothetical protein
VHGTNGFSVPRFPVHLPATAKTHEPLHSPLCPATPQLSLTRTQDTPPLSRFFLLLSCGVLVWVSGIVIFVDKSDWPTPQTRVADCQPSSDVCAIRGCIHISQTSTLSDDGAVSLRQVERWQHHHRQSPGRQVEVQPVLQLVSSSSEPLGATHAMANTSYRPHWIKHGRILDDFLQSPSATRTTERAQRCRQPQRLQLLDHEHQPILISLRRRHDWRHGWRHGRLLFSIL